MLGLMELLSAEMYQIDWYYKNPMMSFEELRSYTMTLQTDELKRVESRAPRAKAYYIRPAHVETRGTLFDSTNRRESPMNEYFGMVSEKGCTSPSNPARCQVLKQNQN
ncbi:MAG TPA: hypothetical protein PK475_10190 [Rectinema sp.]|nr:hypothetical protein [Rectinema sp.]